MASSIGKGSKAREVFTEELLRTFFNRRMGPDVIVEAMGSSGAEIELPQTALPPFKIREEL